MTARILCDLDTMYVSEVNDGHTRVSAVTPTNKLKSVGSACWIAALVSCHGADVDEAAA